MAVPYPHVFERMPDMPWKHLENHELSRLHRKFWGKRIEHNWQERQRAQFMDIDSEESSEETTTEVVSGCFVLDLGIKSLRPSKLWVRKDYIRIYDYCSHHVSESTDDEMPAPSIVITGQPGIGKTYWILYAVRRRLGESEPFIWYYESRWHLFVEDGVFLCPPVPLPAAAFRPYIWTFVDADNSSTIPLDVAVLNTKLFTIFSTSPKRDRWKPLERGTTCVPLIMNPWTWEEIIQAAAIHGFTRDQLADARTLYNEYGPTACICIHFNIMPKLLPFHYGNPAAVLSYLSMDQLLKVVGDCHLLAREDVYHSILLLRREDVDNLQDFTVEPTTLSIRRQLKIQVMKEEQKERLRVYNRFSQGQLRNFASLVFEAIAQLNLQEEIALNFVRLVKEPPASGKKIAQWVSPDPVGQGSGSVGADAANTPIPIRFKPKNTIEYEGSTLKEFHSGFFYVPSLSNQVGFDSFVLADQVLYIFQFSNAHSHSHEIKGGIMDFFSQPTLRSMFQGTETHFVFIVPPGGKVVCPESNGPKLAEFWEKVTLFSAEFNPEKRSLQVESAAQLA